MDLFDAVFTRRSTRKFKDKPVDGALLSRIIEAGRYAPSGGNSQSVHFIVVENREILNALAVQVKSEFSKMEVTPGMYKSMAHSITASKSSEYVFHYNAPVLIIMANRLDYGNSMADCSCALENMMLAANALNLGSCWINQLRWLSENEEILKMMYDLGMEQDERVFGALAVGFPATEDGLPNRAPLARTGNKVTYIK